MKYFSLRKDNKAFDYSRAIPFTFIILEDEVFASYCSD